MPKIGFCVFEMWLLTSLALNVTRGFGEEYVCQANPIPVMAACREREITCDCISISCRVWRFMTAETLTPQYYILNENTKRTCFSFLLYIF